MVAIQLRAGASALALSLSLLTTVGLGQAQTNTAMDSAPRDEVVVTGQKIERSLQETKESVAVLDRAVLDDLVLLSLEDTFEATANAFAFNDDQSFGLRGVTQNSAGTGGGSGELATLYIDGVAYTGFSNRFGPKDLWDVERVEILRGPQSTNVGRNALAGAVAVTTARPELDGHGAALRGQFGNAGTYGGEAMVNIPVSDTAGFRFTAERFVTDGFIDNVTLGTEYDARDNQTYRGKFLWQPTDSFSALASVQYADTERGEDLYRADLSGIGSRESSANLRAFDLYEAWTGTLDLEYDFNDQWSVRSITSIIDGDYSRFDDDDQGPEGGNAFRGREAEDFNWAEELRVNYNGERLRGVAGVYYTEVEVLNDTLGLVNIAPANVGVPAPLLPFYPANLEVDVFQSSDNETTNFALFGEFDYGVTDRLRLTAGLRYDDETQTVTNFVGNKLAQGSVLPDPTEAAANVPPQLQPIVFGGITQVNAVLGQQLTPVQFPETEVSFDAFLPSVGLTYDVSDTTTVAGFYKRGYRAGGVEVNSSGVQDVYDPEFLDNFELALRYRSAGGRVQLNANAYYGLWEDQQIRVPQEGNIFNTDIQNAAESTLRGFELEGQLRANARTTLYASLGWADTEFDDYCLTGSTVATNLPTCETNGVQGVDLEGNRFALSPEITASFGGRVDVTDALYVSGSANYRDSSFSDVTNVALFENDEVMLINLKAGYQVDGFEVALFGRNVTDEDYTTFRGSGIGDISELIVRSGTPAEYGILVSKRFGGA